MTFCSHRSTHFTIRTVSASPRDRQGRSRSGEGTMAPNCRLGGFLQEKTGFVGTFELQLVKLCVCQCSIKNYLLTIQGDD